MDAWGAPRLRVERAPLNIDDQIRSLEKSGTLIVRFFTGLEDDTARWKEEPHRWSLLEILCHLHDEERLDFRKRIELTLRDPAIDWPSIFPGRWVAERDYNSMNVDHTLIKYRHEREKSIEWLRSLTGADWDRAKTHPKLGILRAGDLLVSWIAHDLVHIRQAANTALARQMQMAEPYSTRYALP